MADLPELVRLEAQFPGDRLSPRQLRHHLGSPRAVWQVLALPDGRLLGYLLVLSHAQRVAARLYSLVIDLELRGQGLAARLLEAVERQLGQQGVPALRLEVREDNAAAIGLYHRRGFRLLGRKPGYYQDGAAALCMQLVLSAPGPE